MQNQLLQLQVLEEREMNETYHLLSNCDPLIDVYFMEKLKNQKGFWCGLGGWGWVLESNVSEAVREVKDKDG